MFHLQKVAKQKRVLLRDTQSDMFISMPVDYKRKVHVVNLLNHKTS